MGTISSNPGAIKFVLPGIISGGLNSAFTGSNFLGGAIGGISYSGNLFTNNVTSTDGISSEYRYIISPDEIYDDWGKDGTGDRITKIRGRRYYADRRNLPAEIGNKINAFFGGDSDYFVEHQVYNPTEERMMNEYVNTAAATLAGGVVGKVVSRGVGTLSARSQYINLASPTRTAHIIAGDATGGGHAWFGSLKSFTNGITRSKSMFPATWNNSKIMHAVSNVATNNLWIQQTGRAGATLTRSGHPVRFVVEGFYQGTKIRVITTHTEIITAFTIR